MRHRMYDPKLGRFTQTDPILSRRAFSHYAYASNIPTQSTDPLGLYDLTDLGNDVAWTANKVAGAVVGTLQLIAEPAAQVLDVVDSAVVAGTNAKGWTNIPMDKMYYFSMQANSQRQRIVAGQDPGFVQGDTAVRTTADVFTLGTASLVEEHLHTYEAVAGGRISPQQATNHLIEQQFDRSSMLLVGGVAEQTWTYAKSPSVLEFLKDAKKTGNRVLDTLEGIANDGGAPAFGAGIGGTGGGGTGIRNAHLAGKRHPVTGIAFDASGFPDFSPVAIKTVKIKQTGSRARDFAAANEAAGLTRKPDNYTWHHHQDGTTMQLVPSDIHRKTGHTGGFAGGD